MFDKSRMSQVSQSGGSWVILVLCLQLEWLSCSEAPSAACCSLCPDLLLLPLLGLGKLWSLQF